MTGTRMFRANLVSEIADMPTCGGPPIFQRFCCTPKAAALGSSKPDRQPSVSRPDGPCAQLRRQLRCTELPAEARYRETLPRLMPSLIKPMKSLSSRGLDKNRALRGAIRANDDTK
jgi:hypothetical protein